MAGTKGKGTKIGVSTIQETPSYTDLAQIRDVSGPDQSVEDIDMTYTGSTANEYEPGFIEGGTVTVELLYVKAQSTTVAGLLGASKLFKITYADNSAWTFQGYVNGLGDAAPYRGEVTQSMSIKVSGLPVFAAAS